MGSYASKKFVAKLTHCYSVLPLFLYFRSNMIAISYIFRLNRFIFYLYTLSSNNSLAKHHFYIQYNYHFSHAIVMSGNDHKYYNKCIQQLVVEYGEYLCNCTRYSSSLFSKPFWPYEICHHVFLGNNVMYVIPKQHFYSSTKPSFR